jgi:hypothetical protein
MAPIVKSPLSVDGREEDEPGYVLATLRRHLI